MNERTAHVEDWEAGDERIGQWSRAQLEDMNTAFAVKMAASLAQRPAGSVSGAPAPSTSGNRRALTATR